MTKIIATYRIPYDVDIQWNDGCNGTDFVSDRFGDEVLLIISDSGSMYICPENSEGWWRSLIDSCGYERRFNTLPGKEKFDGWRAGRWPAPYDILSCGLSMNRELPSRVESTGGCGGDDKYGRLPTMFEGLNVEVGGRKLAFENGGVSLNESHGDCYYTDYWIDESGIPWARHGDENQDSEGYYCTKTVTMAAPADIRSAAEFLKREAGFIGGIKKQAVRMAADAFERTTRMLEEIETFEKVCGE